MGKIKSKMIRRAAKSLDKEGIEFTESFEKNKKILKMTMPSKKLRNQLAGLFSKLKKQERQKKEKYAKIKE